MELRALYIAGVVQIFFSIFPRIAFSGNMDLDYAKLKSAKQVTFYLHVTNYFVPSPNMNEMGLREVHAFTKQKTPIRLMK